MGAILSGIEAQSTTTHGARLTPVASRANVAYDRLRSYLVELEAAGLVEGGDNPRLTPRGRTFLAQYRRWMATLGTYGLAPAAAEVAQMAPVQR